MLGLVHRPAQPTACADDLVSIRPMPDTAQAKLAGDLTIGEGEPAFGLDPAHCIILVRKIGAGPAPPATKIKCVHPDIHQHSAARKVAAEIGGRAYRPIERAALERAELAYFTYHTGSNELAEHARCWKVASDHSDSENPAGLLG